MALRSAAGCLIYTDELVAKVQELFIYKKGLSLMDKKIDIKELKRIQMDMLKAIDLFCKQNNIKYSLAYGTLLGAIRHQGYIPWDDDLDIMLLREDYTKFLRDFQHETYSVISPSNNIDYSLPYAKVFDRRTIINEYADIKCTYGVNIDVFPVDNAPNCPKELKKFLKKKDCLNKQHILKILKISKNRNLIKNLAILFGHIILSFKSLRKIVMGMDILSSKYRSNTGCKLKGIIAPNDNRREELLPSECFDSYTNVRFEGIEVMAIEKFDEYLKATYGDYMQLPPKEKRISHHQFEAYWKE